MSDEFENSQDLITPDLVVFESQLRSLPIADSKLNRDELLYKAGWSAAIAAQNNRSLGAPSGWAWKISTGALTALAALLAIMLFQQSNWIERQQPGVATNTLQENKNATESAASANLAKERNERSVQDGFDRQTPRVANQDWQPSLFLKNEFHEIRSSHPTHLTARSNVKHLGSTNFTVYEINDQSFGTKTTMELLREMVPMEKQKTNKESLWRWLSRTWGEKI